MSSQFLYRSRVTSCVTPSLLGTTPILLPIYMQMTEDVQVSIADAFRSCTDDPLLLKGCLEDEAAAPRLPAHEWATQALRAAPACGS